MASGGTVVARGGSGSRDWLAQGRLPLAVRILSAPLALFFLFAAVVQYNDPDPLRWMAIYGAAALMCSWAVRGLVMPFAPALVGLVALLWCATIAPRVIGHVAPADLFREVAMATPVIEEAREAMGLLIVAVWMALIVWGARRRGARLV